jgi:hypothetical protein
MNLLALAFLLLAVVSVGMIIGDFTKEEGKYE